MAAVDLGTNNCRLLIAAPAGDRFRVVETYSRIVRLGEGLSATGALGEAAMARALEALEACATRIRRRRAVKVRAVATQACRIAANGRAFIAEAARRTGIHLQIIAPRQEAQLAVAGCLDLIDRSQRAAIVLDVGGGSTELSWIDLTAPYFALRPEVARARKPPIHAWHSAPVGVVSLAERFPEPHTGDPAWYGAMVEAVQERLAPFARADGLRPAFAEGAAHLIGTSGAITSLAGMHLRLPRYLRERVDGLWMTRAECQSAAATLAAMSLEHRAAQPCIGRDRADLVLAGAAILEAVQRLWPCERVRVADRGLREGLVLEILAERRRRATDQRDGRR